jgi:hypothetical protein
LASRGTKPSGVLHRSSSHRRSISEDPGSPDVGAPTEERSRDSSAWIVAPATSRRRTKATLRSRSPRAPTPLRQARPGERRAGKTLPRVVKTTTRARSVLFLAAGLAVAAAHGSEVPFVIPENGFIGANVPLHSRSGRDIEYTDYPLALHVPVRSRGSRGRCGQPNYEPLSARYEG